MMTPSLSAARFGAAPTRAANAAPARFGHETAEADHHVHGPDCNHDDHADHAPKETPFKQRLKNFFSLPTSPNGNWKGNAWVSGIAGAVLGSLVLPGPGTLMGILVGWGLGFLFAPTGAPPVENVSIPSADASEDKPEQANPEPAPVIA